MATPLHRHRSSLEGLIDFSPLEPLKPDLRSEGTIVFKKIISSYEPSQSEGPYAYKPVTLIRVTHEHAVSKDNFLNTFFLSLEKGLSSEDASPASDFSKALSHLKNFETWDTDQKEKLATDLAAFAKYLIDHFFLPLKASARKTPQPTPAPVSGAQTPQQVTGITQRISVLRRDCLRRDRHRCVITRKFDTREALERIRQEGDSATDDDGKLLKDETERSEYLEVAHILPHSLMAQSGQTDLNDSKKTALSILNMFDPGVIRLIEGPDIDRPTNAVTLTQSLHQQFGDFEVYFEATTEPHTYHIDSVHALSLVRHPILPVTRTLLLTPDHTIDPPSPRLLAIHRAIARILNLSGAGDYIDRILRDLEEVEIKWDGSTKLEPTLSLMLGGWVDGVSVC